MIGIDPSKVVPRVDSNKLVNITPITLVYDTDKYTYWGLINQLTTCGGPTL